MSKSQNRSGLRAKIGSNYHLVGSVDVRMLMSVDVRMPGIPYFLQTNSFFEHLKSPTNCCNSETEATYLLC